MSDDYQRAAGEQGRAFEQAVATILRIDGWTILAEHAHVAGQEKLKPESIHVEADVTIDQNQGGFFLAVALKCKIDGMDRAEAQRLVEKAHEVCPYSKATRGNVDVKLEVV